MSGFIFIGQDGTKFVFDAESINVTARGKKLFVNGTLVAEYLSVGEYLVPVKHFQAEPFIEYAWARESIDEFLAAVQKLPSDFIDEFFREVKIKDTVFIGERS